LAQRRRSGDSIEPARYDLEVGNGTGAPKVKLILAGAEVARATTLAAAGVCLAMFDRGRSRSCCRPASVADKPIVIDGLWSLAFGTFAAADPNALYFIAALDDETEGLFGKITVVAGRH